METPSFNLKAVVRETGIKAETLRAWERRYGLPRPARSAGGHRIYSRRDIDTLHWLIRRRKEGLSISRAAERWQTIESEGRDPLQEPGFASDYLFLGERWTETSHFEEGVNDEVDIQVSAACSEWMAACTSFDELKAQRVLSQAFARFPVETVCLHVLCKGLRQLGEDWLIDIVTAQQVNFAADQAMQRIKTLLAASPQPTRSGQIMMACPSGEEHTFGLALLQLFFKRRGFGTVYLGGNLPSSEMVATLQKIQPDLFVLVSQQLRSAGSLLDLSELIVRQDVPVAFGGRIFNVSDTICRRIPGSFLGTDLLQAGHNAEIVLSKPCHLLTDPPSQSNQYEDLLASYRANLPRMLAEISTATQGKTPEWTTLVRPTFSLSSSILSALRFGDPSILALEADWLCTFLKSRNISISVAEEYLLLGLTVVQSVLGSDGSPIVEMLETLLNDVQQRFREST
jgi:DNA-binding transcriptional MerR regulator